MSRINGITTGHYHQVRQSQVCQLLEWEILSFQISWSISTAISCAETCIISASTSTPCMEVGHLGTLSNVHLALGRLVFASTVCLGFGTSSFYLGPSAAAVASLILRMRMLVLNDGSASSPALAPPPLSAYLTLNVWLTCTIQSWAVPQQVRWAIKVKPF